MRHIFEKMLLELRVSDLKQYFYCPRIVFYQYVLPVERKTTYKMEHGRVAHEEIVHLESRRKLTRYGLSNGTRHFNLWINSKKWGLAGKLDMMIETENGLYPVDFKFTKGKPFKNHIYQLGGYALILEDCYERPVNEGFLYLLVQKDVLIYSLSNEVKDECIRALNEIRNMVKDERFPPAPKEKGKCLECEYQNYCRDTL